MSLGMTLIRANTLAFGLIGKDGPHGIIKICFGNTNLVFGSEVALLGFWEYMFRILLRVWGASDELEGTVYYVTLTLTSEVLSAKIVLRAC
jgi:hypothetical protein